VWFEAIWPSHVARLPGRFTRSLGQSFLVYNELDCHTADMITALDSGTDGNGIQACEIVASWHSRIGMQL
jgi:hypothetical protein